MIPALPVLGFVVDHAVFHLGLGDVQIALIVGGVVHRVPQAPLHDTPDVNGLGFLTFVGQHQIVELAVFAHGHEEGHLRVQAVLGAVEGGVAHAVTALVTVKLCLGGQEAGVPGGLSRFLDVVEPAAVVAGDGVVTVAQKPLEFRVPVEAVAAAGVGDHAEEILAAQVIDPWQRGGRCGNHIFPPGVIEVSKLHMLPPCSEDSTKFDNV